MNQHVRDFLDAHIPARKRYVEDEHHIEQVHVAVDGNFTVVVFIMDCGEVVTGVSKRNAEQDEWIPERGITIAANRAYDNLEGARFTIGDTPVYSLPRDYEVPTPEWTGSVFVSYAWGV
jgi:hypothetical protein